MPTELYLVRHGESVANVRPVIGGMRGDAGLTDLGRNRHASWSDGCTPRGYGRTNSTPAPFPERWRRRSTWRGHCGFRCSSATTSTSFAPETPTA
jgi:hypothetical protein